MVKLKTSKELEMIIDSCLEKVLAGEMNCPIANTSMSLIGKRLSMEKFKLHVSKQSGKKPSAETKRFAGLR